MNHQLPYSYETEIEWTNARKGKLNAPDLPSIEIAAPPEFKGHAGFWTPEHLYVAAVNACFMTTFLAIAELSKLEFTRFSCRSKGKLDKHEAHSYQITEIVLHPQLVIAHDREAERARRILEKAEANCLISNSIRTVVTLEPEITVVQRAAG